MYRVSRPHLLSLISILAALTFFTACSQDPYLVNTGGNLGDANSLTDGAPDGDYRLGDGLRPDGQDGAVPEAGPCVPSNNGREICDQKDNDCNGKVDDVDATLTLADVDNCGKCGNACLFVNAFAKCDTGKCVMTSCAPGYYDINKDPSNGCEYQCLVSNKGVEICDGADNNCDGNVDETFDLQTDKDNCGKCGRRCLFSNGTGECQLGQCALTGCTTGYQNNNKSDTDGCEYKCPVWPATQEQCNLKDDDCDGDIDEGTPGSGVICDTPKPGECKAGKTDCQGGKLTCVANKTASAEICDTKDNDCDGKADEDFDLDKSVLHCGVCNKACTFPNAVPKCENRVCKIDRCINGFANLDANAPGCEYPCPVFPTTTEKCNGKDDDCDKQVDEGFDLAIDPKNCGKCGNVCTFPNATGQCSGGKCIQGACAPDYYDTDPTKPGCELYCLKTHGGTEICDGADNNCDGQTDEGFNKQTDENNCGTCGNICQFNNAAASCSGGKCIQGACTTGFKDLDPVAPGCETQCPVWPPTTGETSTSNRCDGVDNDCDGHVDEDFPTGAACGLSAGECATGALSCTAGVESCIGGTGPSVEICDGKDNDCDTHIDEDFDKLADPRYCENCKGCTIAHAIAKCVNGTCARAVCEQGWVDNDANPDCEYQCTVTGQEICDGIDNDCDGQTDNGLTAPSNACVTVGPCAGATATCQGIYGWVCNYGASVEKRTCTQDTDCLFVACDVALGVCPGELPDDESLCDAADNDCDGLSDEPFTNKGLACAESGKQGICQGTGKFICRADHTGTVCSITSPGQTKRNELCNGKD
ncbi:MAG: hypothetical protein KAI47_05860, partial [Deltaproteobacteria bacterium]|nr:hypothetical protein [Deltaproteobacteria bacterium]